jgi:hypothetical protein
MTTKLDQTHPRDKRDQPPVTRGGPDQPRAPDVYGSDATSTSIRGSPGGGVEYATIPPAPGSKKPSAPEQADIAADDAGASARTETPQAMP